MLTCYGCMRSCLQTIIGIPLAQNGLTRLPASRIPRRSLQRTFAALATTNLRDRQLSNHERDNNGQSTSHRDRSLSPARFEETRQVWLKSRGVRPPSKARKPNFKTDLALKQHLQYLQDPLKLADYVKNILRQDDFETAEKVVQYASKTMQCVVSWNHLVSYQLSQGKMNAAIKTFNDMKKRAQTPDAHTYTIIFKGCAEHKESTQALEKVLAIYHSMSADKCPVKPNTIHVNAVLKMCARAGDLDAMFAIADHLPEKGIRAPNNLTFTTILNGIRQKLLFTRFPEMSAVQSRNESHKLLIVARHLWSDVVKRWRQGDIWIDEELVCAMGRLLLTGDERDADDILSLVQQTMAIPRQFPSRPYSMSAIAGDQEAQPTSTATPESVVPQSTPLRNMISNSGSGSSEDAIIPFTEVIVPKTTPPQGVAAFPVPGRNTLSLVMAALLNLKTNESAKPYWDILTSPPYSIIPDGPNYADYLRVLRVTRSSKELVSVLTSMPREYLTRGIFRIAMSTCVRDKNNPNSFNNAGKVLDLMQSTITTPDAKILEFYLELALKAPVPYSTPASSSNTPSSYEEEALLAKRKHGSIIARALQRLAPNLNSLRATLSFGDEETPRLDGVERQQFAEDVERLARVMVSAYDKLMNNGMVDRRMYVPYSKERSKIAAYITRLQSRIAADKKARRQKKVIDARETDMKKLNLTKEAQVVVDQKEQP